MTTQQTTFINTLSRIWSMIAITLTSHIVGAISITIILMEIIDYITLYLNVSMIISYIILTRFFVEVIIFYYSIEFGFTKPNIILKLITIIYYFAYWVCFMIYIFMYFVINHYCTFCGEVIYGSIFDDLFYSTNLQIIIVHNSAVPYLSDRAFMILNTLTIINNGIKIKFIGPCSITEDTNISNYSLWIFTGAHLISYNFTEIIEINDRNKYVACLCALSSTYFMGQLFSLRLISMYFYSNALYLVGLTSFNYSVSPAYFVTYLLWSAGLFNGSVNLETFSYSVTQSNVSNGVESTVHIGDKNEKLNSSKQNNNSNKSPKKKKTTECTRSSNFSNRPTKVTNFISHHGKPTLHGMAVAFMISGERTSPYILNKLLRFTDNAVIDEEKCETIHEMFQNALPIGLLSNAQYIKWNVLGHVSAKFNERGDGDKVAGVYIITLVQTGEIYVGHSIDLNTRLKKHAQGPYTDSKHIYPLVQEYGTDAFKVSVMVAPKGSTVDWVLAIEQLAMIELWPSINLSYVATSPKVGQLRIPNTPPIKGSTQNLPKAVFMYFEGALVHEFGTRVSVGPTLGINRHFVSEFLARSTDGCYRNTQIYFSYTRWPNAPTALMTVPELRTLWDSVLADTKKEHNSRYGPCWAVCDEHIIPASNATQLYAILKRDHGITESVFALRNRLRSGKPLGKWSFFYGIPSNVRGKP